MGGAPSEENKEEWVYLLRHPRFLTQKQPDQMDQIDPIDPIDPRQGTPLGNQKRCLQYESKHHQRIQPHVDDGEQEEKEEKKKKGE